MVLTKFNFETGIYLNHFTYLCKKLKKMEETQKKRGGKRAGSGRKPVGLSTTPMSLKLDNDLYQVLQLRELNKNRYINDAVRTAMLKDGFIN